LIQYCPDSARAEAANIGVILLCPDAHYIGCKLANGNDRPRRFFSVQGEALERLEQVKEAFEARIELDRGRIWKLEDFEHFIETRGNKLLITPPRNTKVLEPDEDLMRLYKELVGGRAKGETVTRRGQGKSLKPRLRSLFAQPEYRDKVQAQVEVTPKYARKFEADYAFYNGKDSFVEAPVVHVDRDQTLREAQTLAYNGVQLHKHGLNGRKAELIVSLPNPEGEFEQTTIDVADLLRDSDVRTVFESDLDKLLDEIRLNAHLLSSAK